MPKAYYQCPKCKRSISTRYKSNVPSRKSDVPKMGCGCSYPCINMTYRGDGWEGRDNWVHGKPDWVDDKFRREWERLSKMGFTVTKFSEQHWRVDGFDFWPSTGTFKTPEGQKYSGMNSLIKMLKKQAEK